MLTEIKKTTNSQSGWREGQGPHALMGGWVNWYNHSVKLPTVANKVTALGTLSLWREAVSPEWSVHLECLARSFQLWKTSYTEETGLGNSLSLAAHIHFLQVTRCWHLAWLVLWEAGPVSCPPQWGPQQPCTEKEGDPFLEWSPQFLSSLPTPCPGKCCILENGDYLPPPSQKLLHKFLKSRPYKREVLLSHHASIQRTFSRETQLTSPRMVRVVFLPIAHKECL
jgi:hypothetical protein